VNTYVREDQVMPHLAAIAILLAGPTGKPGRGNCSLVQVTGPDGTAALIDRLRTEGTVLTYDPDNRALRAGEAPSVTVGKAIASTRPRQNKERRTA
jgi:hypothetical protein